MGDRRRWLPALLLSAGCVLLLGVSGQRTMPLRAPLATIPAELAGYRGADEVLSTDQQRVAGMSSYLFRRFGGDSAPAFSVYVGYYDRQTQGRTIHSPRNCLPGAGWEPLESSTRRIETAAGPVVVNRYLLANGASRALVYYWYQGRGRVAANEYRVKWDLLRDAALRRRSEEALVRIVVPLASGNSSADALAGRVAAALVPEVRRVLPADQS